MDMMNCQTWLGWIFAAALSVTQIGSASESNATPGVIVVLGDSLTAGFGVHRAEAYPALLQDRIKAAGWNFTVVNAGQNGDTTAGGLRRMEWLLQRPMRVLILALGGNDGLRGIAPEVTRSNLQAMINLARQKYPDIQIVLAGMEMSPNMGPDYITRFRAIYPDLAQKNQLPLIPFLLDGVGGRPEFNQDDMIHPTAAGQKIIAENVWRVLQPLLQSLAATPSR
jgi:acyl-CoA thioesterase-1